jgi:hypothetical protein
MSVILALTRSPARFLGDFHLDCRKPFNPRTQVIREHKCAATAFDGAQLAGTYREDRAVAPPVRFGLAAGHGAALRSDAGMSSPSSAISAGRSATGGDGEVGSSLPHAAQPGRVLRANSSMQGIVGNMCSISA